MLGRSTSLGVAMGVTVVAELRPRPDRRDDAVRHIADRFGRPNRAVHGRWHASLYQSLADSTRLLYVGHWDTRQAFEDDRTRSGRLADHDWFEAPPVPSFYRSLRSYERVCAHSGAASVVLIDGPTETAGPRRELVLGIPDEIGDQLAAVVAYEIGQDEHRPGCLVAVIRWRSEADRRGSRATWAGAVFDRRLAALGGTIRRFDGLSTAESSIE